MGLIDTVKAKAGELAADAERAGRVAAAQTRLVSLQGDLRRAERELGQTAYALTGLGELRHPDLEATVAAVAQARAAVDETEREIGVLRSRSAATPATAATRGPLEETVAETPVLDAAVAGGEAGAVAGSAPEADDIAASSGEAAGDAPAAAPADETADAAP